MNSEATKFAICLTRAAADPSTDTVLVPTLDSVYERLIAIDDGFVVGEFGN